MAKRSQKPKKTQVKAKDLVAVARINDYDQAKDYEMILRNNDIPVVLKEQYDKTNESECIDIMVPEELLDEAHVIIESQETYNDFFDLGMEEQKEEEDEDEMEMDFDSDFSEEKY